MFISRSPQPPPARLTSPWPPGPVITISVAGEEPLEEDEICEKCERYGGVKNNFGDEETLLERYLLQDFLLGSVAR